MGGYPSITASPLKHLMAPSSTLMNKHTAALNDTSWFTRVNKASLYRLTLHHSGAFQFP
uniref:Uncharacterized protein n=1 Tax=Anguilla anguilla TaxID=7936 RepID=A0A0E9SWP3_ANGAN